MATFKTTTAVGQRESLSDVIARIDPSDVPLYANMKKETTKAINHEFLVQELAAAVDTNAQNEGADYSYTDPEALVRLGNIHQIATKAGSVSGTLDAVDRAGRDRETAFVKVSKGLELRKDINKSFYKNEAKSSSDPRKCAKLPTWITNGSFPSDMAAATGDGSDLADFTGTARAMTLAQIDAAMLAAYNDGGNPSMLLMSPVNKQNFSALSSGSVATNQITMTAPKEATIIGSASVYLSDFNTLSVTVDRACPNSEVYLIDPEFVCMGTLSGRDMAVGDVAPTGDATKFFVQSEYTLIVKAPKAHSIIAGLNGS